MCSYVLFFFTDKRTINFTLLKFVAFTLYQHWNMNINEKFPIHWRATWSILPVKCLVVIKEIWCLGECWWSMKEISLLCSDIFTTTHRCLKFKLNLLTQGMWEKEKTWWLDSNCKSSPSSSYKSWSLGPWYPSHDARLGVYHSLADD